MKLFFKYLLVFFFHFFVRSGYYVYAQNLVKNPSFENYIQCPNGASLFNGYAQSWFCFTPGDASLFNSCASIPNSVPQNIYGFQTAMTGNGYACIMVKSFDYDPNKRMYIEGTFNIPLKQDSVYCISYFVSLCDNALGAIQNLDAYISDTLLDWNNGIPYVLTGINPQVKSSQIINDSISWKKVNGLYCAHGGENYITIGNFLPDAQSTIQSFQPGNPIRIDYYIDDVSVTPTNLIAPNLGNDTIICQNTLPYNLTAPVGYDSYLWSNGNTSNNLTVNDSGTYWVKCIMAGCGEISDTMHIGFKNTPVLKLGNDTILCVGNTLNVTAQAGFNSYLWNTNSATQNITVNDSGLYIVQATDACGIQTDSINVGIDSLPNIAIDIGIDTTLCNNDVNVPLTLSTNMVLPNYYWSTGATTSQITATKKGWYWIKTEYYCGSIQSDSIYIDECPQDTLQGFYMPNSFTPNNDGLNDFFAPILNNTTIEDFKIFNRWGNLVYESKNNISWDGRFQNRECPQGLYIYRLTYRNRNNIYTEKIGKIVLIR